MVSSSLFPLQCSISSSEEERLVSIRRPKPPTSSDFPDLNTQTNWAKSLPLPTPEEKMRQHAQTVQADVVPINITGMLCYADSVQMSSGRMTVACCCRGCPLLAFHLHSGGNGCGLASWSLFNEETTKTCMCVHM